LIKCGTTTVHWGYEASAVEGVEVSVREAPLTLERPTVDKCAALRPDDCYLRAAAGHSSREVDGLGWRKAIFTTERKGSFTKSSQVIGVGYRVKVPQLETISTRPSGWLFWRLPSGRALGTLRVDQPA
jgi:hypothetical protein